MADELQACPFCGDMPELVFIQDLGTEVAQCKQCRIRIAMVIWNGRHTPAAALLEEARDLQAVNRGLWLRIENLEIMLLKAWDVICNADYEGYDDELRQDIEKLEAEMQGVEKLEAES